VREKKQEEAALPHEHSGQNSTGQETGPAVEDNAAPESGASSPAAENPAASKAALSESLASKNKTLLVCPALEVQSCDIAQLLQAKRILQHGNQLEVWQTPEQWSLTERIPATLNIDLRQRILHFLPKKARHLTVDGTAYVKQRTDLTLLHEQCSQILDKAVEMSVRYLVLMRIGPVNMDYRRKTASLDTNFVKALGYSYIPAFAAVAAAKLMDLAVYEYENDINLPAVLKQDHGCFAVVTDEDLDTLTVSCAKEVRNEIKRMRILAERGFWKDVPPKPVQSIHTDIEGEADAPEQPDDTTPHLPLPDEYVAEMGSKGYWLINDLGPALLEVGAKIQSIWEETESLNLESKSIKGRRSAMVSKYLADYVWRDSKGQVITETPFRIRLSQLGKKGSKTSADYRVTDATVEQEWPPRTFNDIMDLLQRLQQAHLFVALLSTAGRHSEIIGLRRSCIQYAVNGLTVAEGRTFKLVQRVDGVVRDWIMPEFAQRCIEQQVRLITLVEKIGPIQPKANAKSKPTKAPDHLWGTIAGGSHSDRTKPLRSISRSLLSYADAIGMESDTGGQTLRPHRFRKTIARLVALALVQAPKILMDVFGHTDIEMTLYYILTDKNLAAEIETVVRELRVMKATETIEEIVDAENDAIPNADGYGGPQALVLRRAIKAHRADQHRQGKDWGTDSAIELAQIFTLQGKAWQYVRPGIICTKFPGTESGPCNKSRGAPEPARCLSHCSHRLEEPFLREDVDGAISDSIDAYVEADTHGNELVAGLWLAQIRSHLGRFEDLRKKWENHPVVLLAIADAEQDEAV
jgi:integrase